MCLILAPARTTPFGVVSEQLLHSEDDNAFETPPNKYARLGSNYDDELTIPSRVRMRFSLMMSNRTLWLQDLKLRSIKLSQGRKMRRKVCAEGSGKAQGVG